MIKRFAEWIKQKRLAQLRRYLAEARQWDQTCIATIAYISGLETLIKEIECR